MDSVLSDIAAVKSKTTEELARNFATIGALYEDGVSLIFDGETEPSEKHYLCNTSQFFLPGDRVKILSDSGTYVVEYVVGPPKQNRTVGLPAGGDKNTVLTKSSSEDHDAVWSSPHYIPSGGSKGQMLAKKSETNYDVAWETPEKEEIKGLLPTGGNLGQVLKKTSSTDYAASWQTTGEIPIGGLSGQFLQKKTGTNFDTEWKTAYMLPTGGSAGQVLQKNSATNGDVKWATPSTSGNLPTGGTTGQLLRKSSNTNYAAGWVTGYLIPEGGTAGQVLQKDSSAAGDVSWTTLIAGNIKNQYNASNSYIIQFRTTSTYGTPVFQIRMGASGTWYTIATT